MDAARRAWDYRAERGIGTAPAVGDPSPRKRPFVPCEPPECRIRASSLSRLSPPWSRPTPTPPTTCTCAISRPARYASSRPRWTVAPWTIRRPGLRSARTGRRSSSRPTGGHLPHCMLRAHLPSEALSGRGRAPRKRVARPIDAAERGPERAHRGDQEMRSRASISANPSRLRPRHSSGLCARGSSFERPIPQIRSCGLASTRTRFFVPAR